MVHSLASHVPDELVLSAESNVIRDALQEGTLGINTGSICINGIEFITSTGASIINSTATTGNSLYVCRNFDSTNTDDHVVEFRQDNIGDDRAVLNVQQKGSSWGIIVSKTYDSLPAVISIQDNSLGGGTNYVEFCNGGATSRRTAYFYRNLDSTKTAYPVVTITQDNATDDQAALKIQQDGTGRALHVESTNSGTLFPAFVNNTQKGASTNYVGFSGAGTQCNYFYRNLASADTSGPVVTITQNNAGDDQSALSIYQYGTKNGLWCQSFNTLAPAGVFYKNVDADVSVGVLYAHQDHITGGTSPLAVRQDDVSQGFIDFRGSNRGIITSVTDSVRSVRVELSGTVYRLAMYADA